MDVTNIWESIIQAGGIGVGIFGLFIVYKLVIFFSKKEEVITNHLSAVINEETASRDRNTVALTRLEASINNFGKHCSQIQREMQDTSNVMAGHVEHIGDIIKEN